MTPRILLVATSCWFATARLVRAFVSARCEVDIVCPIGHPVTKTRAASTIHPYLFWTPLRSIEAAIDAAHPQLVIPCDDLARSHMVRLYRRSEWTGTGTSATRALLASSLGEPSTMSASTERSPLITIAHALGVRAPRTMAVNARDDLAKWLAETRFPLVLKSDESFGGRGVRVVNSAAEADRAWHALRSPPSLARAIKRAIVNRDVNYIVPWLRRIRPAVNVQSFVRGQDANCTIACWQGAVLASVTVLVLETVGSLGPASVIRLIEHREIAAASEAIVRQLKLSGLIGFDFILEEGTGHAHLIELNARATQICHLQLGNDRDLVTALRSVLAGEERRRAMPVTGNDVIALFPQEWLRDSTSRFLTTAHHDVPWDEPGLLRECLTDTIESRAWSRLSSAARAARAWLVGTSPVRVDEATRSESSQAQPIECVTALRER